MVRWDACAVVPPFPRAPWHPLTDPASNIIIPIAGTVIISAPGSGRGLRSTNPQNVSPEDRQLPQVVATPTATRKEGPRIGLLVDEFSLVCSLANIEGGPAYGRGLIGNKREVQKALHGGRPSVDILRGLAGWSERGEVFQFVQFGQNRNTHIVGERQSLQTSKRLAPCRVIIEKHDDVVAHSYGG